MKILWWQENIRRFKVLKRIVTEDSNEIMMLNEFVRELKSRMKSFPGIDNNTRL